MKIPDRLYDVLKWLCIVVIPALTSFYVVLDKCFSWGLAEIVATISSALCTCIGAIVGISSASYYKGETDNGISK